MIIKHSLFSQLTTTRKNTRSEKDSTLQCTSKISVKSGLWNKYKINYLQRAKSIIYRNRGENFNTKNVFKEATNRAPASEQFYTTPFGSVRLSPSMQTKLNWHHVSKTAPFIQGGPTSRLKVSHKHGFWIWIWLHIYINQGSFVINRHSNYRKLNCHTAGSAWCHKCYWEKTLLWQCHVILKVHLICPSNGKVMVCHVMSWHSYDILMVVCVRFKRIVGECLDFYLLVWLMKHKWTVMQARSGWETLSEGQRGAQGLWRSSLSQGGAQLQRPAVFVLRPTLQQEKGQHADGYC